MVQYNGTLDPKTMSKEAKQGYVSWANQRSKCYNKKNPDYKYYGAKNIGVEYSSRDFVGWWLSNLKIKKWVKPTVGRIDHSGNYSFDNIEIQEREDNSSERCTRLGRPVPEKTAPKAVTCFWYGKKVLKTKSAIAMAFATGFNVSTIVRICNNNYISAGRCKNETSCGYSFKYMEL